VRAESITVSSKETNGSRPARVLRKSLGIGGQYLLDLDYAGITLKARVPHAFGKVVSSQVWTTMENDTIILFDENGTAI
jgi:hypothetical protein